MLQDVQKYYEEGSIIDLGYLAYRQSFFRHGHTVKVLNQCQALPPQPVKLDERPFLCKLDLSPVPEQFVHQISAARSQIGSEAKFMALSASQVVQCCMQRSLKIDELLQFYKDQGLSYLGGDDLMDAVLNEGSQLSMWLEVHELAHSLGIMSQASLHPHPALSFHKIKTCIEALDQVQLQSPGFLGIEFLSRGTMKEQLLLVSLTRILAKHIHDLKIIIDKENLLSSQIKLGFGANVAARNLSSLNKHGALSRGDFELAIRKSQGQLEDYQPHTLNEQEAQAFNSMKLYRLKHSKDFDASSLIEVLSQSPLPAIAADFGERKIKINYQTLDLVHIDDIKSLPTNLDRRSKAAMAIDFSHCFEGKDVPYPSLAELEKFICQHGLEGNFHLIGFRGLWHYCQGLGTGISHLAESLKPLGLVSVISSESEPEDSLTISEISELHKSFHEQGIQTVAKLELSAPYNGTGSPFWKPFIDRLLAFMNLNKEGDHIVGLLVQESQNSFIPIREYLKAVSICRIVAGDVAEIITPIEHIGQGVMQPKIHTEEEFDAIADLLSSFGATNLGISICSQDKPLAQVEEHIGLHPAYIQAATEAK